MKEDKIQSVLELFGSIIHDECKQFAMKQMQSNDLILIRDAGGNVTEDVIIKKNDKLSSYTIKNSCKEKYKDFYYKKFNDIIEKFLKSNA